MQEKVSAEKRAVLRLQERGGEGGRGHSSSPFARGGKCRRKSDYKRYFSQRVRKFSVLLLLLLQLQLLLGRHTAVNAAEMPRFCRQQDPRYCLVLLRTTPHVASAAEYVMFPARKP